MKMLLRVFSLNELTRELHLFDIKFLFRLNVTKALTRILKNYFKLDSIF